MKWNFVRQAVPAVLILALLAVFGWGGVESVRAGEKREIVDPGINASLKVMNGTPWVMPPEVEALFPKDAVWDEKTYNITVGPMELTVLFLEPLKIKLVEGFRQQICRDYDRNIQLYGGLHHLLSIYSDIHKNNPAKKNFIPIQWEEVNPRDYVSAIRSFYYSRYIYDDKYRFTRVPPDDPDYYWKQVAPVYNKLLVSGRLLRMQKTNIDILNNNATVTFVRFGFDSREKIISPDNKKRIEWLYYAVPLDSKEAILIDAFNTLFSHRNYTPIAYKGKIHFIGPTNIVLVGCMKSDKECSSECFINELCSWGVKDTEQAKRIWNY